MDEREYPAFDLEDIMREFGGEPEMEQPEETPVEEELPEPTETAEETAEEISDEDFLKILEKIPDDEPSEQLPDEELSAQEEEDAGETAEELEIPEELSTWKPGIRRAEEKVDLQQTRRMDAVQISATVQKLTGDTIRLDGLREELSATDRQSPMEEKDRAENMEDTIHSEPFSDRWEPDYEQPMGEYTPPQHIIFHPRSRLRELKRKLVAGPEKRYYDLSEKGLGKLQAAIFFSILVVLAAAVSTAIYAFGAVQESRLRLMIFGQFLAMLISALLGSFQLIEGVADLCKKRFTLNTLLVFTFLLCCLDGILCLRQLRVPCCTAFSLEMTMSLWNAYHRRATEMGQMDTMRKATRLDGVCVCSEYLDDAKGFLRCEGQVEDFMDHYARLGKPERCLQVYSLVALCIGVSIGGAAGVLQGLQNGVSSGICTGVQVAAVSLLAAMPASAFISQSRPMWVLERRLHKLNTVICGWRGVEGLSGKAVVPLTHEDLYPAGTVRMNGMKFFGDRAPEEVISYASAVIIADNGSLSGLFRQILDSYNGRNYPATELRYYPHSGIGGIVEKETVLIGPLAFMREMDIPVPDSARISHAVYVAINGELSGLFAVHYEKTKSSAAGITTLSAYRKLYCVLTTGDFMLTHSTIHNRFGIKTKRFLLPEQDVREQLCRKEADVDAQALLLTTAEGLAPIAYGITGARVLKAACKIGTVIHMIGGILGLAMMVVLVLLGALELLTPANMFLYQLVWIIPGLLISEWTRVI